MKLAFKLIFALVVGVAVLLGIEAYLSVERERVQFEQDKVRELGALGRALAVVVRDTWHQSGSKRALKLLDHVDDGQPAIAIRWVWLQPTVDAGAEPLATPEQLAPARAGEAVNITVVSASGERSTVAYVPVQLDGERLGALELCEPMVATEQHDREALERAAVLTLLVALIGGVLISILGVRWVGRPLDQLIAKTRRVAAGDLLSEVHLRTNDELETLGKELDTMSGALAQARDELKDEADARVRAVEQLRHADRLATVGTLAAGVAHELGTPLNVVLGHAGLLMAGDLDTGEVSDSAQTIKQQAARMTAIVQRLLEFARRKPAGIERLALGEVLARTVDLLRPLVKKHGGKVEVCSVAEPLDVRADPGQLQQVLSNLIINGLQSRAEGATVTLSTESLESTPPIGVDGDPGAYVRIDIRDDGDGLSQETMDHMFEPFFTTKDVGEGTGLGLSIAHGLVGEQGGWITVDSELGSGSCFSVYLPRSRGT